MDWGIYPLDIKLFNSFTLQGIFLYATLNMDLSQLAYYYDLDPQNVNYS